MTRTPWRLVSLSPLDEDAVRRLFEPLDAEVALPATRDQDGVRAALAEADVVVGDFSGRLRIDAEAVAGAPALAFVQMPAVGVDSCDLDALTAAGVPVANAAGANARSVAEWVLAATLDLTRGLTLADRRMRSGGWPQFETMAPELPERRVGVLGMGSIGAEVVRLFEALDCSVAYWSRRRRAAGTYKELDDLLATSDIVIVCLPLTPETRGLLHAGRLALLPPGAFLVNIARGGIAPDDAVLGALESGRLAGAALDVYDVEPLPAGHPLRANDKVVLSPHNAGATVTGQRNIINAVKDNLRAALTGGPVANVVNGIDPVIRRR